MKWRQARAVGLTGVDVKFEVEVEIGNAALSVPSSSRRWEGWEGRCGARRLVWIRMRTRGGLGIEGEGELI